MKKTLTGPGGIQIVLDSSEIFLEDPGAGTPAMVHVGRYAGTYFCATETGELSCGDYTLSLAEVRWLDEQFDAVQDFLYSGN